MEDFHCNSLGAENLDYEIGKPQDVFYAIKKQFTGPD